MHAASTASRDTTEGRTVHLLLHPDEEINNPSALDPRQSPISFEFYPPKTDEHGSSSIAVCAT